MKVLTTRSHEGNAMLAEKLRARGFEPISLDILSFKPAPDGSGLDERLREETQMPAHRAESPLTCVAVGSGRSLEEFEAIHRPNRHNRHRRPRR